MKRQIMKINRILVVILLMTGKQVFAQYANSTIPVYNYRGNPMILFSQDNKTTVQLSRAIGDTIKGFTPLQVPQMAATMQQFRLIAGSILTDTLKRRLKLATDAALWNHLKANHDFKSYGYLALNGGFLKAMGVALNDSIGTQPTGTTVYYKLKVSGTVKTTFTGTYIVGEPARFEKPKLKLRKLQDGVISLKWAYKPIFREHVPLFAGVYYYTADGGFQALPSKITSTITADSVFFTYVTKARPLRLNKFFIRPADLFGNESVVPSDTATLTVAYTGHLPVVEGLMAHSSVKGITLEWKHMEENTGAIGIEVQRSLSMATGYKVIDTVAATATLYTDDKVKTAVPYYYRLRSVRDKDTKNDQVSSYTTAVYMDKGKPDAPYAPKAIATAKGIRVAWKKVANADGYYVYRSLTSDDTKPETISHLLADTATSFLDNAANRSSRTDYYYTVKAISKSGIESDFSAPATSRFVNGKDFIAAPAGLRLSVKGKIIHVEWQENKNPDAYVVGYAIYKRKTSANNPPLTDAASQPATTTAKQLYFTRVDQSKIGLKATYYDDKQANDGAYEYAVATVDAFSKQSPLSAIASTAFFAKNAIVRPPSKMFARYIVDAVELKWEPSDESTAVTYAIYRRAVEDKDMVKLALSTAGDNTYLDKTALKQKLYVYQLKAVKDNLESKEGIEKTVRTY